MNRPKGEGMKELTEIEHFALEMLFRALGAKPFNGSFEDMLHTIELIPRSPKQVHYLITEELKVYARTEEFKRREFCRFKTGHPRRDSASQATDARSRASP